LFGFGACGRSEAKFVKVFWFFFSKKNTLALINRGRGTAGVTENKSLRILSFGYQGLALFDAASYCCTADARSPFHPNNVKSGDTMKLPLMSAVIATALLATPVFAQTAAPASPAPAAPATPEATPAPADSGSSMASTSTKKKSTHKHSSHHKSTKKASAPADASAAPPTDAPK
jgi:hypothetical protein